VGQSQDRPRGLAINDPLRERKGSVMKEKPKLTADGLSIKSANATRRSRSLTTSAAELLPARPSVRALREAEQACRGCELYQRATQAVGGQGPSTAPIVMVGEAPGGEEDRQGRPFVGPAGTLLDQALEAAGISRTDVFLTNVVKHFKWEARGKRRLHARPSYREIAACRPWLDAELELVRPRVVVCLGATAARALIGRDFRVTKRRGEVIRGLLGTFVATYHPSAVLRAPDPVLRQRMKQSLIDDLRIAAGIIAQR
jgi:DNA polymerase